ncbi:MAG: ImmA/IrrE family metallo-endopeptidase [Parasporobacterium sp.]|nr:ImmA/IrrE family metallo-endopeptidase [Parasporobacterium sp.]MBQ9613673.1 ImmA/IrrE family metallo-endopeptidase [Lachnospiraceae bacterium]
MTYSYICETVSRLKKKYKETDLFELCKAMGILILERPMGTSEDSVKGFFMVNKRVRVITVNSDLPDIIMRIIIAHELGHAVLHCGLGVQTFHDVSVFDESSAMEQQANLFAAELLMDDDDVFEVINQDGTFFSAAANLYVPMELLDFKFRLMKWKGYKLIEPPITSRSNFLKDMPIPAEYNY